MGDSLRFVPQTLPHPRVCLTLPPLRMASEQKPAETVPQILLCLLAPFPLHADREAVGFIKKKKQTNQEEGGLCRKKKGMQQFLWLQQQEPQSLVQLGLLRLWALSADTNAAGQDEQEGDVLHHQPPRSAARSSWLQPPAPAAPGHRSSPARSSSSSWPYSAAGRLPRTALVLSWQRKAVLGDKRGPKLRGFSSPGGEGGTCQGCTKLLQ